MAAAKSTSKQGEAQLILAPLSEPPLHPRTIFLSGTTTAIKDDAVPWRDTIFQQLAKKPVTIYNPFRPDWGSDWKDLSHPSYREQLAWEVEHLDKADLVCVYLHPSTEAPISLLELGLVAKRGSAAVVCVPDGFKHRANVLYVCEKFGCEVVEKMDDFVGYIEKHFELASDNVVE